MLFPNIVYAEEIQVNNEESNQEIIENANTENQESENTESETKESEPEESDSLPSAVQKPILKYASHVQNIGWQDYVEEDELSGTDHKSLRLESFIIDLEESNENIEYRSYIEGQGWESSWKKGGEISGTFKQSKRIEAVQIRLTGDIAEQYDIYYMVHSQDFGWFSWAKNGEISGSLGYDKRVESIRIKLVEKGTGVETENTFQERNTEIIYNSHVQNIGWMNEITSNLTGTLEDKRLESFYIKLGYQKYTGNIYYSSYVEGIGWQEEKKNGEYSGTDHQSKRIEAIKVHLSGELEEIYDIYYKVYTKKFGWSGWAKNNEIAGSLGYDEKITAMEVKLVEKGTGVETGNSFERKETILRYSGYVQNIGQQDYVNERNIA